MILKRTLQTTLGSCVFIGVVIFSFWLHLSSTALSGWLEFQLNRSAPKGYQISILQAKTRVWGISVEELLVKAVGNTNSEQLLRLQALELRLDPWSLLSSLAIPFKIECYDGIIEGKIAFLSEKSIHFKFHDIQPNRNLWLRKTGLILSNPSLNGDGQLRLSSSLAPLSSSLKLEVKELVVSGNPKVMPLFFEIPDTSFQKVQIQLAYQDNSLTVDLRTKGDIAVKVSGDIQGKITAINNSKLNLTIVAKLKDKYQAELGFVGNMLKPYTNQSGQIAVQLGGKLKFPKLNKI
ncbi:MAG: type II secretion system protein GspN [SAR324 cluster bacterium]|uniref:Type II secretion system protein GspN n=1 Tax=SAR324 cluster bacterium TaxID=2024889 RepID=A0A2A4TCC7_9DELT|nr:MAG: type II secretion system protein GspN [SAR324 cluster bacterium]